MFELTPLPYPKQALEPYISEETLTYHHGKHHQNYVNQLNNLLPEAWNNLSLEEVIRRSSGPLFNNAAQVWNHSFYWDCLTPHTTAPNEELVQALEQHFASLEQFKEVFTRTALSTFGSGWAWLVKDNTGKLSVISTANADTPITQPNQTALLTVDVWEHAYYIDYRNARPSYLDAFWNTVNWDFVNQRFLP